MHYDVDDAVYEQNESSIQQCAELCAIGNRYVQSLGATNTFLKMFQGDIQGNPGLEAKAGGDSRKFWVPDDTCGPSPDPANTDQAQLAEAAVEEYAKKKKPKKSRYELERYASKIVKMGGDGKEEFFQHLGRRMIEAGIILPEVTVEYDNINVEADALVGSASIPSLSNVALGILKRAIGLGGLKTSKLHVLKNVSGVLTPGRTTLLVGPPGAGKSVLLQLLAGHFKNTAFCHITGDVKYNGKDKSEFVIQRTAGLVDQYDEHIANLTVHETLDFATACQVGKIKGQDHIVKAMKAHAQKKSASRAGKKGVIDLNAQEGQALTSSLSGQPMAMVQVEDQLAAAETGTASPATDDKAKIRNALSLTPVSGGDLSMDATDEAEFETLLEEISGTGVKTEVIIRLLGIQNCVDTVVGNAYLRGVSGGERKRVTSAEMLVGTKRVLLMDEISTGLDSATTYSVVKFLSNTTHVMGLTTMIGLLQPPPEVYAIFDDVLLLTDGQVCFHGPVDEAIPFFRSLGFECPVRKDPANFLQEVTTPKGQVLFSTDELKKRVGIPTKADWAARYGMPMEGPLPPGVPEYDPLLGAGQYNSKMMMEVEKISEAFWRETPWGKAMKNNLKNRPFSKEKSHPEALTTHEYELSWYQALRVVLRRQWTLTLRDRGLIIGRLIQVVIMSLIIGSLFSGIDKTATGSRAIFGVSFLSIMFLAMGAMPQLATTMTNKGVFFKQRNNKFFPVSTYAYAMAFSHMPFGLIEAVLYTCIVYFIVGYERGAGYFFIFYLICFSMMQVMSAIMRFNACASPNMVISNSCGALTLLVLIITSGYAIVRTSIPGWWIWAYWISPFAYGLRAVVINEMTSPGWSAIQAGTTETVGVYSLKSFGFFTDRKWIWIGVGYLWGFWFLLTNLTVLVLKFFDPEKSRPSIDDGASAPEDMSTPQRVMNAVSLKNMAQRMSFKKSPQAMSLSEVEEGRGLQAPAPGVVANSPVSLSSSLPFIPISLTFRDLKYFVDAPSKAKSDNQSSDNPAKLELLKGITGYSAPGVLTALMGGSGAGKTTLMDVIAGRKTQGKITGDILVNGYPKDQKTWSRVVGYVEQMDIHSPQATVKEALMFSARLRLDSSVSDSQVKQYVDEVIGIVELLPIQNKMVGMPKVSGLSVEQRKRLTIAVELVANPSVVFMDEPTSGLDARAAAIVMRSVKNVSRNGRTVMVTIHQPSIEIFEGFDALFLLQRGGRLTYFGMLGHESCNLIKYLEGFKGVAPIKRGHNPATWMLEVTGGATSTGVKASQIDFPAVYKESALCSENNANVERLIVEGQAQHKPLSLASMYAASEKVQMFELMKKWAVMYWRSPAYNLTRFLMTTLIALFYGSMYLQKGRLPASGGTVGNVQNIMGVLYSCTTFLGMFNMMSVMPILGYERSVMYRERAASMYSCAPYATASGFVELPYLFLQSAVFVPIAYWMISFEANAAKFFFFWLVFLMALTLNTFLGQLLVIVTPNQQLGQLLGSALNLIFQIFNGFMLPYPSIPRGWKWLNRCSPSTWILYALAVNQLGNRDDIVKGFDGNNTIIHNFLRDYFGYKYEFRWYAVLITAAYLVAFRVFAMLALKYMSFQRR